MFIASLVLLPNIMSLERVSVLTCSGLNYFLCLYSVKFLSYQRYRNLFSLLQWDYCIAKQNVIKMPFPALQSILVVSHMPFLSLSDKLQTGLLKTITLLVLLTATILHQGHEQLWSCWCLTEIIAIHTRSFVRQMAWAGTIYEPAVLSSLKASSTRRKSYRNIQSRSFIQNIF